MNLKDDVRQIWDANAAYWDERMGDGNDFQLQLVAPAMDRLLELRPGETILDIGCGNGLTSRRLSDQGAEVVAFDFAPAMVDRARARSLGRNDRIDYLVVDATDIDALLSLGESRFDAAVSSMALMDMAEIDPLFTALTRLLKPGGRFVFAITHPCFNNSGTTRMYEETDDGELHRIYSVKVSRYLNLGTAMGLALEGQPEPQYYFNRTLEQLFGACFRAGLVIDGLKEPGFAEPSPDASDRSLARYREVPFALVVRCRTTDVAE
ncbi:MAG TPA: class I SAM-dependent methyltransferase [Chloroflexota bacterium]|jgi:ubiquinone/menaquinone biosynthesis C-methylase UbiE|nr:class I SAM-dependent methyltransferase [Chloroflexota bacterium]